VRYSGGAGSLEGSAPFFNLRTRRKTLTVYTPAKPDKHAVAQQFPAI
jgi:hypothetical protein